GAQCVVAGACVLGGVCRVPWFRFFPYSDAVDGRRGGARTRRRLCTPKAVGLSRFHAGGTGVRPLHGLEDTVATPAGRWSVAVVFTLYNLGNALAACGAAPHGAQRRLENRARSSVPRVSAGRHARAKRARRVRYNG